MLNLFCSSGYTHQHQLPVVEYNIHSGGHIGKLNVCCIIPTYYTHCGPKVLGLIFLKIEHT